MTINTNVGALFSENALTNTSNMMDTLQQEMSTGYSINTPADSPSDLAISNLMTGELGNLGQNIQNIAQGVNLLNTANGGVQTALQMVQQLQSLAVQASNGPETTQDRGILQHQAQDILDAVNKNSQITYNGQSLLDGNSEPYVVGGSGPFAGLGGPNQDWVVSSVANMGGGSVAITSVAPSSGFPVGASVSAQVWISMNPTTYQGEYAITLYDGTAQMNDNVVLPDQTPGSSGTVVLSGAGDHITYGSPENQPAYSVSVKYTLPNFQASSQGLDEVTDNTTYTVHNPPAGGSGPLPGIAMPSTTTDPMGWDFQVGPRQGAADVVTVHLPQVNAASLGLASLSLLTASNAQSGIAQIQSALSALTSLQSYLGSKIGALQRVGSNVASERLNLHASRAGIDDANMAQVSSSFSQQQILEQTGLQALSEANQLPGMVLKYLG